MPLLGGFIFQLMASLVEFFVKWFTKKTAVGLAAVALVGTLVVGLFATMSGLLAALAIAAPAFPGAALGLYLGIPSNFAIGISSVLAIDSGVALYKWNMMNVRIMATAS